MRIGVPTEHSPETRVAIVPSSLKKLSRKGFEVVVEAGAGAASGYADGDYETAGATVVERPKAFDADLVIGVGLPDVSELREGSSIACVADPFRAPEAAKACIEAKVRLLSMDLIPRRLSRAQSMDVNSSQDNLAGYKAALLGAAHVPKAIPMMTTSAGTVKPARCVVMGSGVAGLQAIATAKRLGAVVYASDVRLAAKEQIESVGGRFILVEGKEDIEDAAGYAKPLTPEFIAKVNGIVNEVAAEADLVITTARIFGRPAP
ncbi:MAG: NAD(P)(+) transhydrogenase (Re/Si-specific) subunit alpha, partial [Myxococcota bacterium]